jgi:large subunit ribosomal protein L6
LSREIRPEIAVEVGSDFITCNPRAEGEHKAFHGMERALINNMVVGVSEGYEKILEINGVGYRADVRGNIVDLNLGFSHPCEFALPEGVQASLLKEGRSVAVKLEAADKQLLGETAARIRSLRPPEPYKGKGIRYRGEEVRRKAGKTGK